MENRRSNISADKFSSSNIQIPNPDPEFEFGCVTVSTSPNSPADHLFSNGRLLPHYFPAQPITAGVTRSTSRASSRNSSKDSLMSSRSNSTNSRTSSCSSSARTSTSNEGPDQRRVLLNQAKSMKEKYKGVFIQQYGSSSQRWQFITPAPVVKQVSRRKKGEIVGIETKKKKKKKTGDCRGFCRRFFKSFVSACKECHAIKPSVIGDGLPRNL